MSWNITEEEEEEVGQDEHVIVKVEEEVEGNIPLNDDLFGDDNKYYWHYVTSSDN